MSATGQTEMTPDAVELLTDDHRRVEGLFAQLEGPGGPGPSAPLVQELVRELSVHAAIEEQVLYPALRKELPEGDEMAEHAIDEHQQVKELLARLDGMEPNDPQVAGLVSEISSNVREHVQEEESDVFPRLRQALAADQLRQMGEALEKAKKMAPTRPHPNAPSTPPGNVVAGAAAAVVDKARDAAREG